MAKKKLVDSLPQIERPDQPSRIGKRVIAGHFEPEVSRALKILAAEMDTTVQMLLTLAINDLLEKKGLGRLADETQLPRGLAARKR